MEQRDSEIFRAYLFARLFALQTWAIAAVVGTFINIYGLVLVPLLRGVDPVTSLLAQLRESPTVSALTIALAYGFPVAVSALSSALALFANRRHASLAQFPDRKPDPVFRVDATGVVVDAGEQTSELFREYGVRVASDVLGADVWAQIETSLRERTPAPVGLVAHFEKADRWYLVSHSATPDGHLNLYLTSIAPELATRMPETRHV